MSDEECDLDTLTALLEDSDNEIDLDKNETKPNEKISSQNLQEKQSDDECDLETISAFLDDSDTDDETVQSSEKGKSKIDGEILLSSNNSKVSKEEPVIPQVNGSDKIDDKTTTDNTAVLQAELQMMQKRMMELQEMLMTQQNASSATTPSKQQVVEPAAVKPSIQQSSNHISTPGSTQKKNGFNSETGKTTYKELDKNPFFSDDNDVTNSRQKIIQDKKQRSHSDSQSKMSYSQMASQKKQNKQVPMETNKQTGKKPMETELFGDNSDSDWDELDGDDKVKLSEEGQELKKIMKQGSKERISYANKEDVEALRKRAEFKSKSWNDKTSPPNKILQNSRYSSTAGHNSKENDLPSVTDAFSGIRIINPKVSALDMKMKMADRKLIKVSRIASKVNTSDLQGNWVTIAVVVHKTEPRTSSTGKTYCIWKLSDLQDCDKTVSLFLFGEVYKQHWKNEVKTVIGLLNPNLMDKAEKVQQDLAFTVNHPQQILVMGYSKDIGKCAGVSRAGNSCTNFINRQQGDYCTYHVKAAYKKSSSTRTELQGSFSGVTPKNMEKKGRSKKDSYFFYGGETYTTQRPSSNTKKGHVTLDKLQNRQEKGRVTTLTVNDLKPEIKSKPIKDETNSNTASANEFADLLNIPSAGSMNFVKHLIKKEKVKKVDENSDKKVKFESVSAKDLLKQHKEFMKQKIKSSKTSPVVNPLSATPTLGRGFYPGGNISLDSPKLTKAKSVDYDVAKKLAIAKIRNKGGLPKEDPNSVRKKTSPQGQEKIKKRVLDSIESESKNDDTSTEEPPKKRSRLLGSLDVNSEEFKKLMSIKSKHTGALAEVEAENEARYFMELEKREKYEDKMSTIMEMKCVVFTCRQCNYTAFKVGDNCKKESHTINKTEAMKRFFKCKKCGWRIISIDKYPTQCCKECGEYSFERVAMYQERKGPKLPSEELSIRGNEMKHVGSHQKMYMNL